MIGWLQGQKVEAWQQGARKGVLLACAGVGYEVQLTARHLNHIGDQDSLTLWIHQVQRDDGSSLFGFPERRERDLFRTLIGVSGVGPQMGLALLGEYPINELIEAIVQGDLRKLSRAQGVGKRTAERLAVELRTKLTEFSTNEPGMSLVENDIMHTHQLKDSSLEELQSTLTALGYEDLEIRRALKAVASGVAQGANGVSEITPSPDDTDGWLKASLRWLSQEAA
ncbi:MAG: Holliday junction branch migration protein RuvA [Prochlorococcus sp.]|nr:Holliday junction branch migration protein RuvA [Prochlorococcus sp.]MDP6193982.1 Holliday junction branch migration protein RuvA [Prochlorococcaceae cyanobacterium ETNP18_MAG_1]CAI8166139.1 MAG: Holliday junction ATP-dependent DNA helicase RuvA [Prochlorococcus marinus str. MIT 9215]